MWKTWSIPLYSFSLTNNYIFHSVEEELISHKFWLCQDFGEESWVLEFEIWWNISSKVILVATRTKKSLTSFYYTNRASDSMKSNHTMQSMIHLNSNGDKNISPLPWLLIEHQSNDVKEAIQKIKFPIGFYSNINNMLTKKKWIWWGKNPWLTYFH